MGKTNTLIFSILIVCLTSCHLGPKYSQPLVETPLQWKSPESSIPAPNVDFWWQVFNDETLNSLEIDAINNNPNLYVALERVLEARAMAGVSRANLFPQLNANPSYQNTMFLTKLQIPTLGILPVQDQTFRIQQITNSIPLDLSYQLDLWGTYRGQYESAVYNAQAQEEAYYVALLTLTSDLASSYYQVRALDAQIDLLTQTKQVRKDAYEVNQARWDGGLINYTDVTRAALEYTNAEAQLYDSIRQRNNKENQLAVLVGVPASNFKIAHNPLEVPPPSVPATLPSTILLNRPDIAKAERDMASTHALIGVAYAAFFPQISLTGTLGYLSPDLTHFLKWKSRLWSYGAEAAQNIFDGGRNISNLEASWASFYETSGTYQNQVLTAFQEVEDALSDIELQSLQYESLKKSIDSAKLTTILSTDRYNKGLVNYLDVVDSERAELQVEKDAIDLLGQRYLSTIHLIKALGGTWNPPCTK